MTQTIEAAEIRPDETLQQHQESADDLPTGEDVRTILRNIAALISDVDRRHGEALCDMQSRLATLGHEARSVRDRVPEHYQPAFERIEDGLSQLAERIARSEVERAARTRHDAPELAECANACTALAPVADSVAPAAEPAPAATASAIEQTDPECPVPQAAAAVADPFDVTEAPTHHESEEPWDRDQAERLTRLYEAGEAGLEPLSLKVSPGPVWTPPVQHAPAAVPPLARPLIAPTPPAAAMLPAQADRAMDEHRAWLETKFAEIAERVELSLADMRPDSAFAGLETRFEQMESRFSAALEDVASRTDPDALRLVEAHIQELAHHVEDAQAQLQRLGSIEAQLSAVVEQLSDQRLVELLEHSSQHAQPDLHGLALAAAEEVAARMAALQPAPAEAAPAPAPEISAEEVQRIGELRDLLHSFMLERRQGEENTASMLDTMQHAMIRLLDRVEAIELAQTAPPAEAPTMAASAPQAMEHVPAQAFAAEPPAAAAPAVPPSQAHAMPRAAGEQQAEARPPMAPAPVESAAGPAGESSTASDRPLSLEQLRAAARRAQQAAAAADAEAKSGKSGKTAKPAKTAATKPAGGDANTKRKLLIGAIVLAAMLPPALVGYSKLKGPAPVKSGGITIETPAGADKAQGKEQSDRPAGKDRGASLGLDLQQERGDQDDQAPAKLAASTVGEETDGGDTAQVIEAAPAPTTVAEAAPATPASAPAQAAAALPSVNSGLGMPGVTIQQSKKPPTAVDIARLRNQQQMAQLSGRLGEAQARAAQLGQTAQPGMQHGEQAQEARPTPISYAAPAPTNAGAGQNAQEMGARASNLELPPVMIGPLSLRLAAGKGDPSAEFEVAARFAEGKGVQQDFKQAMVWYQRAATQGLAQAQYRLGTLFERGLGTTVDLARARIWYQRAAEQGSVKAMHNLAVLSAGRDAGSPDYGSAAVWFQQAAERGLADSQFNLAVLHENGLGVAKNHAQAYAWYSLAALSGDKESARRRDLIKGKLGPAEVAEGEKLVREFKAKPTDKLANDPRAAGEAWKSRAAEAAATN